MFLDMLKNYLMNQININMRCIEINTLDESADNTLRLTLT